MAAKMKKGVDEEKEVEEKSYRGGRGSARQNTGHPSIYPSNLVVILHTNEKNIE